MNKEPLGLYLFRFLMGLGLFIFMCMLYWSSVLVENNMEDLKSEMSLLRSDLSSLRGETEKIREELFQASSEETRNLRTAKSTDKTISSTTEKNPSPYKNLLLPDPFYDTVLPEILGENFAFTGIQHRVTLGRPENLHPFSQWAEVGNFQALCGVTVGRSKFGTYETLTPDMALRMEERINPKTGVPEYWVFLRDNVFWQPLTPSMFPPGFELDKHFQQKHQVTAEDFKFYVDAILNSHFYEPRAVSLRTFYEALEEVEVIDKLTFVVRWKAKEVEGPDGKKEKKIKFIAKQLTAGLIPLASFVYKYFPNGKKIIDDKGDLNAYRTNSVWAQNFAEHWAKNIIPSCGPWIFTGMTERQLNFKRNKQYFEKNAALSASIEYDIKESVDNAWQQFKNNHLDMFSMQPDQIGEFNDFLKTPAYAQQAAAGNAIQRLDYLARIFTYLAWNNARPLFSSPKVRRALTMAIDRKRIVEEKVNGMGVVTNGTFHPTSNEYNSKIEPWPFNPAIAKRLLEEEGWHDSDGDGIIDKVINGKVTPFSFSISYPVKNPTFKSIGEFIVSSLKDIGIECRLNGLDTADLTAIFDDKNFDCLLMMWRLGTPPDDPRQLWHSSGAKEKGSSNMVGFVNAEIDKIIDQLEYEYDPKKRLELYHRFSLILHEEQPYTFLYVPKIAMLYRQYLKNVFIPADRQDLVPGANVEQPDPSIFYIKH